MSKNKISIQTRMILKCDINVYVINIFKKYGCQYIKLFLTTKFYYCSYYSLIPSLLMKDATFNHT